MSPMDVARLVTSPHRRRGRAGAARPAAAFLAAALLAACSGSSGGGEAGPPGAAGPAGPSGPVLLQDHHLLEKLAGVETVVAYGGIVGRAENRALIRVDQTRIDAARRPAVAAGGAKPVPAVPVTRPAR